MDLRGLGRDHAAGYGPFCLHLYFVLVYLHQCYDAESEQSHDGPCYETTML